MILSIFVVMLFGVYLAICFHLDQRLRTKETGKIVLTFIFSVSLYLSHAVTYSWLLIVYNDGQHHLYFIGFIICGIIIYQKWLVKWGDYFIGIAVGGIRLAFFFCHIPYATLKLSCLIVIKSISYPLIIIRRWLKRLKVKYDNKRKKLTNNATNDG